MNLVDRGRIPDAFAVGVIGTRVSVNPLSIYGKHTSSEPSPVCDQKLITVVLELSQVRSFRLFLACIGFAQ
jgi:hypothetical protein